jgi:hypothetical protein
MWIEAEMRRIDPDAYPHADDAGGAAGLRARRRANAQAT